MLTFNKIYGECYISVNKINANICVYFSFSKLLDYIVYVIYICPMLKNKDLNELTIPAIYKFSVHNIRPLDPYAYAIRVENATDKSFHISLDGGDVKYEADVCKDNTTALMSNIEVGKLYYVRVERADNFV